MWEHRERPTGPRAEQRCSQCAPRTGQATAQHCPFTAGPHFLLLENRPEKMLGSPLKAAAGCERPLTPSFEMER